MQMMTEKKMWKKIKETAAEINADSSIKRPIKFTRIESSTEAGIPDVVFLSSRSMGMLELKVFSYRADVKTDLMTLGMTPSQIQWLAHSDRVMLLVYIENAPEAAAPYLLITKYTAELYLLGNYTLKQIVEKIGTYSLHEIIKTFCATL